MDQENNFLKFYESLTQEEIEEEINTLNNIKLSVDFWEYIATDPEKLLAIIHYNNLEEKYGIKIDKRKFIDTHPIGALGYTKLKVDLYKGIIATINVHLKER